jgi:pimeloyl-ACP methyl ester carboxylesterase
MDATRFVQLATIRKRAHTEQSPVVFLHGFPDSPDMFQAYHSPEEQRESWIKDRSLHALALPNRLTNPVVPTLADLISGVLYKEFAAQMDALVKESPNGKLILIAHDWGAAYAWRYIKDKGDGCIERMVALSVAPSPRFDVWEHGVRALGWSYRTLFSIPYYIPATSRSLGWALKHIAGYEGPDLEHLSKDCYHYWDGIAWPLLAPVALLYPRSEQLDFSFPILFIRSRMDRFATTQAFERKLRQRADSRLVILPPDCNHWFPAQKSELVLQELRTFLAPEAPASKKVRAGAESAAGSKKKKATSTRAKPRRPESSKR